MTEQNYYAMIMAGGGGTRLWPLSRQARPKQALKLFGDKSLFQTSVDRITPIFKRENIMVLTTEEQADILGAQVDWMTEENFILEPAPRGTASVVGFAATILDLQAENCVMACLTADHFIQDESLFCSALLAAYDAALDGHLVTLGITPDYADTGYGYIQRGENIGEYRDMMTFEVIQFKEKPDKSTAESYVSSKSYVWNSGMFVWRVDRILGEIKRQMPALYESLQKIRMAWDTSERGEVVQETWMNLKSQTIDYGIMEGAQDVVVIPVDNLGWRDVGDWSRLYEIYKKDEDSNVINADASLMDAVSGTLVIQQSSSEVDRLIAAIGVEGLVVIDTDDVLLICHQDHASDVKKVVEKLQRESKEGYL